MIRYQITLKGYMDPEEFEYFNDYIREHKEWRKIEYFLDRFEGKYIYAEFVYYNEAVADICEEVRMIAEGHFNSGSSWEIEDIRAREMAAYYGGTFPWWRTDT
jgi:hypothetical protein